MIRNVDQERKQHFLYVYIFPFIGFRAELSEPRQIIKPIGHVECHIIRDVLGKLRFSEHHLSDAVFNGFGIQWHCAPFWRLT